MTSALAGLGRTASTKSSASTLSPPCVMSSFNSMSKLETKPARLEVGGALLFPPCAASYRLQH